MNSSASPAEKARLLGLDENLRSEADRMLRVSGLGKGLRLEGFEAAASYAMRTMTWRDLDFERVEDTPDWNRHWQLGARLAKINWVWKFSCTVAYRQPSGTDQGLYWGLRLSDPASSPVWKADLWTARARRVRQGQPEPRPVG
jgi:hypothetical protein